jgi:hypothetical protein
VRGRIRQHVEMAKEVADWEEERDRMNRSLMDGVNSTGEAFLSHTVLNGRLCLRMALGSLKTRWEHLERCWDPLQNAAADLS